MKYQALLATDSIPDTGRAQINELLFLLGKIAGWTSIQHKTAPRDNSHPQSIPLPTPYLQELAKQLNTLGLPSKQTDKLNAVILPTPQERPSEKHDLLIDSPKWFLGSGMHLVLLTIPFGIVSLLIERYRQARAPEVSGSELACMPFASYTDIRRVRERVPEFDKRRYPSGLDQRHIRSVAGAAVARVSGFFAWMVLSPILLWLQGLPSVDRRTELIIPNTEAAPGRRTP